MTNAAPQTPDESADSEDLFPVGLAGSWPANLASRETDAPTANVATDSGLAHPIRAPILSLTDVTITYPRPGQRSLDVVADLTLHLSPGEFACVAGRSGSGKTSILRVAAGLAAPSSGTVRWSNTDLSTLTPDERASRRRHLCGILDQNAALLPELSALENVLLAAVPDRRVKRMQSRAESLLDHLGLAARARHRPAALSGGERQRVGLARAMLLDPPVLIVDEPTASLDREWADTVIDTLTAAAHGGTAVLAASHDPSLLSLAHVATTLD